MRNIEQRIQAEMIQLGIGQPLYGTIIHIEAFNLIENDSMRPCCMSKLVYPKI